MKIWIDLTNSPHVNFFAGMIRDLRKDHQVILTCRPLANTIDLLDLEGFDYNVVGTHYGASKIKKLLGFPVRVWQLFWFLRKQKIDVAISHSSFYSPLTSRLLGVPSVYLNDNEHASGNRISFLCAEKIMVPEFLSLESVVSQGGKTCKILQYSGVKEGVYLWRFKAGDSELEDIFPKNGRKNIVIRSEPWTAQYYSGRKNFMDQLLIELVGKYNVIMLPRGVEQKEHYMQAKFTGLVVPEKSIFLNEIMESCDLFIGAGGTMTREAAVLGMPTISVYQDKPLEVDKYLIDRRFMVHEMNPTVGFIVDFLGSTHKGDARADLMNKGKEACAMITDTLLMLGDGQK